MRSGPFVLSILVSAFSCGAGAIDPQPTPEPPPDEVVASPGEGMMGQGSPSQTISCEEVTAGRASARLLTRLQYELTVQDLLGLPSYEASGFPDESTFLGFGNNADVHRASLVLAEQHTLAAQQLAERAVGEDLPNLMGCSDQTLACALQFAREFGSRAFRRPISDDELAGLEELFTEADSLWGFNKGVELVLQTILQSPQFLYRTESLASRTPSTEELPENVIALDSFQVASRMSYFLWNRMPDRELTALAQNGALQSKGVIAAQARRMLDDDRARATVADFYSQWLGVSRFSGLARQVDEAGVFVGAHNEAWLRSLEQFAQHTFWEQGGTLADLFTSDRVFLDDANTAALYGLSASSDGTVVRDPNRAGLLAQPALMALLSHPDQSAPIQRGKFVREQLLCQPLLPPPPTVDASPPDLDPNATTRERFAQHTANSSCSGCHRLVDGIGFGLEGFDHLGRYRLEENGLPVDTSGDIVASTDENLNGTFDGVEELSQRLAASPQVQECMATQWFRYSMGRAEQTEDACNLAQVAQTFVQSGGSFQELFIALTTTDAFRYRPVGEQDG